MQQIATQSQFLDNLTGELRDAGMNINRMSSDDFRIALTVFNQYEKILWISQFDTLEPGIVNDHGKAYYGYQQNDLRNEGFELFQRLIHPDHFSDMHKAISFFHTQPDGVHKMTYRVRNADGEWKWHYSTGKAISFTETGVPKYTIHVVYEIEGLMVNNDQGSYTTKTEHRDAYQSLTKREREILYLIAKEMTSHEIAERLYIEPSTVDTHRKRIIKKLKVKSSIGMVRFALAYPEMV